MSFRELEIEPEYRSLTDDVIRDFYIPVLKESVMYKRAVGFFSSSALLKLSSGICSLVDNGGYIQLIASPKLSEEDIKAINDGLKRKNEVIEEALLRELKEPQGVFEEKRLNLLSNLIAAGRLEIKIAVIENNRSIGMYHEKVGLMYDKYNNVIAFSGSMNESATAFCSNYEAIDVFKSWTTDEERVQIKESAFNALWDDLEPNIKVLDFPNLTDEIISKYKRTEEIETFEEFDLQDYPTYVREESFKYKCNNVAHVPESISIRDYQKTAIYNWEQQNFCGIFDMATGTGKTYTALAAVTRLSEKLNNKLAVVIVCPYQHLVEQWKDDIIIFGMKPIICYSASAQKDWKKRLKDAITSYNLGVADSFCVITTNATFSSDYVQDIVRYIEGDSLLVVDEAHNFGARKLSKTLLPNFKYRLALSATIDRHGDEEGTAKLYEYFGSKCIEYTLKEAIDNNMLTPYYYYPIPVTLDANEINDYEELTAQINKHIHKDKTGKMVIDSIGEKLLIKRARIIAGAKNKISALHELMLDYKDESHILVYCGATTLRDMDYKEGEAHADEIRQIDLVSDMLGNNSDLHMKISKFTSEEDAYERERIKDDFAEGKMLQALVAIRCLDEGVNIPSIKTAFILASSTNPKEYIQRRGRVLRKAPGKKYAVIYDFITLPATIKFLKNSSIYDTTGFKSLALKEITRIKDFAEIAENPFDSDQLVFDIKNAFNLEVLEEDGENYV